MFAGLKADHFDISGPWQGVQQHLNAVAAGRHVAIADHELERDVDLETRIDIPERLSSPGTCRDHNHCEGEHRALQSSTPTVPLPDFSDSVRILRWAGFFRNSDGMADVLLLCDAASTSKHER